ncbi:unnamed protein product [Paramecium octaurelia]|uniref:Uncharacterized protein n=1 Tax=Paramecium octaurelia TaxID=43137 RepID=A0A8S1TA09_PAROT|nr:unnamed protein product [Paramecium octaurelia]
MNQNQQSQDFKCKDHPEKPVLFRCKSNACSEDRIFCLYCQKQNKHAQHYTEDVLSIDELDQFLIQKSQLSNGLISECQIQFQTTYVQFIIQVLWIRRQQIKTILSTTGT